MPSAEHESQVALTKQDHELVAFLLMKRGVAVPDDFRDEILGCTDMAQLDTWLLRAATASTIDDVTRG